MEKDNRNKYRLDYTQYLLFVLEKLDKIEDDLNFKITEKFYL